MPRKGTDVFRLIVMFKPIWSQKYQGEDYDPDGRDWREAKQFLELNPDIFDKREVFIQRAMKFMEDDFWYKPSDGLRHQCHYFLRQYSRYSNAQPTRTAKKIYCPKCLTDHLTTEPCAEQKPIASHETVKRVMDEMKSLGNSMKL